MAVAWRTGTADFPIALACRVLDTLGGFLYPFASAVLSRSQQLAMVRPFKFGAHQATAILALMRMRVQANFADKQPSISQTVASSFRYLVGRSLLLERFQIGVCNRSIRTESVIS